MRPKYSEIDKLYKRLGCLIVRLEQELIYLYQFELLTCVVIKRIFKMVGLDVLGLNCGTSIDGKCIFMSPATVAVCETVYTRVASWPDKQVV